MMKTGGVFFISLFVLTLDGAFAIFSNFEYKRDYQSYWNLAEKASSLPKKLEGIDKFVARLENSGSMHGKFNAIYMETPDNSFDENLQALKSLQIRMHEIEKMDVKSFEYQTAMQQITQQEQNEAGAMLSVFSGIWMKEHYFLLWDWVGLTQIISFVILLFWGFMSWLDNDFRFSNRY